MIKCLRNWRIGLLGKVSYFSKNNLVVKWYNHIKTALGRNYSCITLYGAMVVMGTTLDLQS